jgi:hypothetical protein
MAYWIGIIADGISTIVLLSPDLAKAIFGLNNGSFGEPYLYVSRIAASLMFGWTILLFWADRKPIDRRDILLITIFPVVTGIALSGVFSITSNIIQFEAILPLWIFNAFLIILYLCSYWKARAIAT